MLAQDRVCARCVDNVNFAKHVDGRGDDVSTVVTLLVSETPTLGVRIREIERICLDREISNIETKFGGIPVKIARYGEKIVNIKPEFETLKEIEKVTAKLGRQISDEELPECPQPVHIDVGD